MIRYALVCDFGHDFEGWFGASADAACRTSGAA
jgi:hypothetical protein